MTDEFYEDDAAQCSLSAQNWDRIKESRTKDGYREGVSAGQEASLQEGFNKGFQKHLVFYQSLAYMSGVLRGVLAMKESQNIPQLSETSQESVLSILERIDRLKEDYSKASSDDIGNTNASQISQTSKQSFLNGESTASSSAMDVRTAEVMNQVRMDFSKFLEEIDLSDLVS